MSHATGKAEVSEGSGGVKGGQDRWGHVQVSGEGEVRLG